MMYDKRKLARYDIFLIVEFKPLRSPGGFSIGITRDLSHDGFSLESQTIECQRGDILEFRLKHPDAAWSVNIAGEVIWRNHSWYKYIVGIKFLNVDEEQNKKISKLMSAVRDDTNDTLLSNINTEGIQGAAKETNPDATPGAVAKDNPLPAAQAAEAGKVSLRVSEHCELTGKERSFITEDEVAINNDEETEEIKPVGDNYNSDRAIEVTSMNDNGQTPEPVLLPVRDNAAHEAARTDTIEETDEEHEKVYATHPDTSYSDDTAQAPNVSSIDQSENNRNKKLWLYVPLAMVVIIIFVIALPVMIEKFNHSSIDITPVLTESADSTYVGKGTDVLPSDDEQRDDHASNGQSLSSPERQTVKPDVMPAEKNKTAKVLPLYAVEDPAGSAQPKSITIAEGNSKKAENALASVQLEKTALEAPQMNKANIANPESGTDAKPVQDSVKKSGKIDLIAKIDETFKSLRELKNEKPEIPEAVMEAKKSPEEKPSVKIVEQVLVPQVVRPDIIPSAAAVSESERNLVEKQEAKATQEKKVAIKKPEPAVKRPDMPNIMLLVKRDKPQSSINNSPAALGITTSDLLKKWKPIGNTKSGVPLFIAPDNTSYPHEHVVNLLVKASVNKKEFIDLLAINCSQIKLRILEERSGSNPVLSTYSNEWKDIIPDSMILYNSACTENK